jgi:hypothetical protein
MNAVISANEMCDFRISRRTAGEGSSNILKVMVIHIPDNAAIYRGNI